MRRIAGATVAEDLFGAGKDGFTEGSPPSPPATIVSEDWANDVQENIIDVIESEGITLAADTDQLSLAIESKISNRIDTTGDLVHLGYLVQDTAFVGKRKSVSAQETSPTGIAFRPDGGKMYLCGSSGDDVNQYTLSTPWDVSTASFVDAFSTAGEDNEPTGIAFNLNGTKMFIVGNQLSDVYEYALSGAWDTSTAVFSASFSVSSEDLTPRDICFNQLGTKMFIVGDTANEIFQYTLSTGFLISSASYDSVSFSVAAEETSATGMQWSDDGKRFFVCGTSSNAVHQYSCTTSYNLTTASYSEVTFDCSDWAASPTAIAFSASGHKLFIADTADDEVVEFYCSRMIATS